MNKNKNMATTETKPKIYVWHKTERAGDTVTVNQTDGDFTIFTDGTRCRTSLINEMLIEAKSEANALDLAQPFLSFNKDSGPGGPKETKAIQEIEEVNPSKDTQPTAEVNVMLEMLKKISAKNTITMPLELNIPSNEVYDLFKDQMDITKADLNEQILALILSQINNLQEQLKPQAEEFIKNYYNGKTNRKNTNSRRNSTNSGGDASAPDITY
jgi:hypothetical protein